MEKITAPDQALALFQRHQGDLLKMGAGAVAFSSDGSAPAINVSFKTEENAQGFNRWANNLHVENPIRQLIMSGLVSQQPVAVL